MFLTARKTLFILGAALPLTACASVSTDILQYTCPTANSLQQDGIPSNFAFFDTGDLTEGDFVHVTDLDTVRFEQESATIIDDRYATANFAKCVYGTNAIRDNVIPFYIIRTSSRQNETGVFVDFQYRVDPNHSGWTGFCWDPEDQDEGCIVVCHFHADKCPFSFGGSKGA